MKKKALLKEESTECRLNVDCNCIFPSIVLYLGVDIPFPFLMLYLLTDQPSYIGHQNRTLDHFAKKKL